MTKPELNHVNGGKGWFCDPRLGWAVAAIVLAVRVWMCAIMPTATADVVRELAYGGLILKHGLWVAGYSLQTLNPNYWPLVWSELPIGYPIGSMIWFAGIAAIWPTMFFARLALTAIEAACGWTICKLTGRGCMGLFYWAAPMSIWWVSREAQFEPIQNLPVLLGLLILARRPRWAMLCLAIAVQMKVTALLLLPWFIVENWRRSGRELFFGICFFILGFLPSILAQSMGSYRALTQPFMFTHPLVYNPYWWDFTNRAMFGWNPAWMVAVHQLSIAAALLILIDGGLRAFWKNKFGADWIAWLAPIAYLFFVKTHININFWYFLIWPTLILPLPDGRRRTWLYLLWPLLDVSSIASLIHPGFGNHQPALVFMGLGPFDSLLALGIGRR